MGVRLYQGDDLAFGAQVALDSKLWVPGWAMRPALAYLANMRNPPLIGFHQPKVAIAFNGREALAAALFNGEWLMAFCRRTHRMQGHAQACVRTIGEVPTFTKTAEGVYGSTRFWARQGHYVVVKDETFVKSLEETITKGASLIDDIGRVDQCNA